MQLYITHTDYLFRNPASVFLIHEEQRRGFHANDLVPGNLLADPIGHSIRLSITAKTSKHVIGAGLQEVDVRTDALEEVHLLAGVHIARQNHRVELIGNLRITARETHGRTSS